MSVLDLSTYKWRQLKAGRHSTVKNAVIIPNLNNISNKNTALPFYEELWRKLICRCCKGKEFSPKLLREDAERLLSLQC